MVCNRSYTNYPVIELCAKTHLTNEMKYAIMCVVVDTVYCVCVVYVYATICPLQPLYRVFYVVLRGLYISPFNRAVWGLE